MNHPIFEPLLRRWQRSISLSEAEREAVLGLPYERAAFARDAYMVREGEPTTSCVLLLSGFAFRQKFANHSARQIISFHIPGEFVDLQNAMLEVADHNVQSLGPSEAAIVPRQAIVALMAERPKVALAIWLDTLLDASVFREWVVNVGRRNAPVRIAHLLCELVLRLRSAGQCEEEACAFPLTQEQLADATGLTVVHTNRTLQRLRREGLIELATQRLTVLDWDRLAELGDFNERYLHHGV